jgi:hypothetical protein
MQKISLLVLTLALTACSNGKDDSGDTGSGGGDGGQTDLDGDGFYAEEDDCNDDNASINPNATEACNGYDDNCDGLIDDSSSVDALTWYPDSDSDNYGDEESAGVQACSRPDGYVSDNTDCNDGDADFNPSATEDDCADPNDYNCDGSVGYEDADGDGYAACDECDDSDGNVYPGATEDCATGGDDDCDGLVNSDDPDNNGPTWYPDFDGDGFGSDDDRFNKAACEQPEGYVDNYDDCNNLDADDNPDAPETCDGSLDEEGRDNDCDGTIDEASAVDASTWYLDSDSDGFGDVDFPQIACYQPESYVSDNTDCDDAAYGTNPDADEYCSTLDVDDDCDGTADEGTAIDATLYYFDNDGDDYGTTASTTYACSLPSSYAEVSGDCDDYDDAVSPGSPERCSTVGVDDDCDAVADESGATDANTYYTDSDSDGFGDIGAPANACSLTAGFSTNDSDCDDEDGAINPDADEVCNDGIDNNCDDAASVCVLDGYSESDTVFEGVATNDGAGDSVAYIGDISGDGVGEIMITAQDVTVDGASVGAAYLYYGPLSAEGVVSLADADVIINGYSSGDKIGKTVSGDGDINDDGLADFVISTAAPNEICDTSDCISSGSAESGATWVFYDAPGDDIDVTAADAAFVGGNSYDRAGVASLLGDLNDDGYDDIAIGANAADLAGSSSGTVYVIYGPMDGLNNLDDEANYVNGENANDKLGQQVSRVGDVNDDGYDDMLTSTVATDSGTVYLNFGPVSGVQSAGDADVILTGEDSGDSLGASIGPAGDVNGDGYDDYLIGATSDDDAFSAAGAVYLVYGPGTTGDLSSPEVKFTGGGTSEGFGTSVRGGQDVNGDGELDLLMGGPGPDTYGEAYLFFGPFSSGSFSVTEADATITGNETGDGVGSQARLTGDIDGLGTSAILLGAPGDNENGTDSGGAYLIFGIGL